MPFQVWYFTAVSCRAVSAGCNTVEWGIIWTLLSWYGEDSCLSREIIWVGGARAERVQNVIERKKLLAGKRRLAEDGIYVLARKSIFPSTVAHSITLIKLWANTRCTRRTLYLLEITCGCATCSSWNFIVSQSLEFWQCPSLVNL